MTISISQITSADQPQWDEFVIQHSNATPYHLFAWGAAVEKSYGFTCFYFVAKENDQIKGILPMVAMRTLSGQKLLCTLPYCDVGGILSDTADITSLLKQYIFEFANSKNIKNIEVRGSSSELMEVSEAPKNKKVRMILSLPKTAEDLMAQFKSKLRSQIRKAQKNGLTYSIIKGSDATKQDIANFYDVIAANMRDLGSPVHSFAWFESIVHNYKENMFLAIITKEDTTVGAGLVLKHGTGASIPWASTLQEFNKLAPNMLLYWAVLDECCKQGISTFDFGRSTVGEGTFNFKKQWGCQAKLLNWEAFSGAEKIITSQSNSSSARKFIETTWRHMPLGMTKVIGPKLRKYISL